MFITHLDIFGVCIDVHNGAHGIRSLLEHLPAGKEAQMESASGDDGNNHGMAAGGAGLLAATLPIRHTTHRRQGQTSRDVLCQVAVARSRRPLHTLSSTHAIPNTVHYTHLLVREHIRGLVEKHHHPDQHHVLRRVQYIQ